MLRQAASALMIVVMGCGFAAAADLELLPKGHPKAQPAAPSAPAPLSAPSTVKPQPPESQAPPPQAPATPPQKPEAPAPQAPSQQTPAQQAPSQQSPAQPLPPQRLQSPPAEQGKITPDNSVPDDDKRLNDLQPPALPAPGEGESWWQKVVRNAPNCRTFSDGCRTCDAKFTCSSMPIACQPKEFVCTDPKEPGQ